MDKEGMIPELAEMFRKVVEDIRSLADSLQAVCTVVTGGLPVQEAELQEEAEEKALPEITLEQVRGVLAEKSRGGHTAEVRAIIQKYGADRLSAISPGDYAAILKEAEVL